MPISDTEYGEDADRIEREYIDPGSASEDEIRADLENEDFANDAIEEILDWYTTSEDVEETLGSPHSDGITTREDVVEAIDERSAEIGNSDRREQLEQTVASEIGAPSADEVQDAQFALMTEESVTPGEVIEGDERSTPVSVVRNTEGNVVGTVGQPGTARDVAEEMDGEFLGSSPEDFEQSLSVHPAPDGSRGTLVYDGSDAIGEVDL